MKSTFEVKYWSVLQTAAFNNNTSSLSRSLHLVCQKYFHSISCSITVYLLLPLGRHLSPFKMVSRAGQSGLYLIPKCQTFFDPSSNSNLPTIHALSSQPAYHSKQITGNMQEACSCALCPIRTEIRGPAPTSPAGKS